MTTSTMTAQAHGIPPLQSGDRLTRDEFERRYAAMPHCKKAELVEGVVFMPSPVTQERHGRPHFRLSTWTGNYVMRTPGVDGGDNATVRLDFDNEPQPDLHLRLLPPRGGRSRVDADGYIEGPPELAVEVAASSVSYDLHDKLRAYRRNGVQEYLVWRVDDGEIDWLALRGGRYEQLPADGDGVRRSEVFPGLWLDVPALLRDDMLTVQACLERGLASDEHAAFAARLRG
jgi:Uma2 family endonuclease